MDYEWDDDKAAANFRKHRVKFDDAIIAVEDPNRLERVDTRNSYGEERVQVIGMAWGRVLFVVTTLRGEDTCRIISARRAENHEEDWYYAGDG